MLQIFKNAKLICEEIQKVSFVHLQKYKLNLKEIQKTKLRGLHQEILCTAALCTSLLLKTHDAFQNPNSHATAKNTNGRQTIENGQI